MSSLTYIYIYFLDIIVQCILIYLFPFITNELPIMIKLAFNTSLVSKEISNSCDIAIIKCLIFIMFQLSNNFYFYMQYISQNSPFFFLFDIYHFIIYLQYINTQYLSGAECVILAAERKMHRWILYLLIQNM